MRLVGEGLPRLRFSTEGGRRELLMGITVAACANQTFISIVSVFNSIFGGSGIVFGCPSRTFVLTDCHVKISLSQRHFFKGAAIL